MAFEPLARILPDADPREVGQQSLRAVIERYGIVVIDRDGAVLFAKPAAERLLGIPFSQLVRAQVGFPHTPGGAIEIELEAGGAPRVAEMRVVVDQLSAQRQTAHAAANPRAPSQPGTFPRRSALESLPTDPGPYGG